MSTVGELSGRVAVVFGAGSSGAGPINGEAAARTYAAAGALVAVVDLVAGEADRYPFAAPSGMIEVTSATIAGFGYDDCPGHPVWLEPREWLGAPAGERIPLHVVSNQPSRHFHSQYDNGSYSRGGEVAGREPVLIKPVDVGERGIASGDVVRLWNARGACLAEAVVTDEVRPGVVVLATGAWFDPEEPGVSGSLERRQPQRPHSRRRNLTARPGLDVRQDTRRGRTRRCHDGPRAAAVRASGDGRPGISLGSASFAMT